MIAKPGAAPPSEEKARRAAEELGLQPGRPWNLGALALHRPAANGLGTSPALRWHGAQGARESFSFAEIARRAGKFANTLKNFGVHRGDRVFFLTRHIPDLHWDLPATMMYGAVAGVLGTDWGTDRTQDVLSRSGARLLVVEADLKPAIDDIRKSLPELWQVLVIVRRVPHGRLRAGDFLYSDYYEPAEETFPPAVTGPGDPAIAEFSEPGSPGVLWSHGIAVRIYDIAREMLGPEPGRTFVPEVPPGHPAFLPYAVLAPLLASAVTEMFEDPSGASVFGDAVRFCPGPEQTRLLIQPLAVTGDGRTPASPGLC